MEYGRHTDRGSRFVMAEQENWGMRYRESKRIGRWGTERARGLGDEVQREQENWGWGTGRARGLGDEVQREQEDGGWGTESKRIGGWGTKREREQENWGIRFSESKRIGGWGTERARGLGDEVQREREQEDWGIRFSESKRIGGWGTERARLWKGKTKEAWGKYKKGKRIYECIKKRCKKILKVRTGRAWQWSGFLYHLSRI